MPKTMAKLREKKMPAYWRKCAYLQDFHLRHCRTRQGAREAGALYRNMELTQVHHGPYFGIKTLHWKY